MSPPLVHHRFQARPNRLRRVRQLITRAALRAGCAEERVLDLVLAVDEACQNIIRHAYQGKGGEIELTVRREADRLVIRLLDYAPPVDLTAIQPRPLDELRPGGLGTHFMRSVMDEIAYIPPPPGAGNLLQMTKRIESDER